MPENLCVLSTRLRPEGTVEVIATIYGFPDIDERSFSGIITNEPQTTAKKPTEAKCEGDEEEIINHLCDYLNFISGNNQDMRIIINSKNFAVLRLYVMIISTKTCNWRDYLYLTVVHMDSYNEHEDQAINNGLIILKLLNSNNYKNPFDIVNLIAFR